MATVVIQLGHCYRKVGATGTNGVDGDPNEQEFATDAGYRAAALLGATGHKAQVILADAHQGSYAGDAFVAIHCDGSTNPNARGASVGYRTSEGHALASAWKRNYAEGGWSGFRPDNYTAALAGYYGTRNAVAVGNRYAFIAECGFLTSPSDEARLSPPGGPQRFAKALTAAVVELFGGAITPPSPPSAKEDDVDYLLMHPNGVGFLITPTDAIPFEEDDDYAAYKAGGFKEVRDITAKMADQRIESARAAGLRLAEVNQRLAAIEADVEALR